MMTETYVLITPARDEEAYIENTITSVMSQTVRPKRWIIVSDGSTDKTDEIVRKYEVRHSFIQLVRAEGQEQRNFSSKVHAFTVGLNQIKDEEFDFIGILDADISLPPDYYQKVFEKFRRDETLGLAGGVGYERCRGKFQKVMCSRNSVNGPFQMFRRQCYEDIGGFLPLERGGEDNVTEVMARMHGWRVESFPELAVYHHRRMGTATTNILMARFGEGIRMYSVGYHALFHAARCLYLFRKKPCVLGSFLMFCGYYWAYRQRMKRQVPDDVMKYLQSEQLKRLSSILLHHRDPTIYR